MYINTINAVYVVEINKLFLSNTVYFSKSLNHYIERKKNVILVTGFREDSR